jgi:23S rRNA (uracil1939-C5)-methyltransferase
VSVAHELPIRAAPDEWRYRHRVRLHVGTGGVLGYRGARSHRIVEIGDCVIADAVITAALPVVRALVPRLATRLETIEILANGDGAAVLSAVARGSFVVADDHHLASILDAAVVGVHVAGHGWQRAWGDVRVFVRPDDATTIVQRPGSFSQVNPAANRLLVETVRTFATPASRVLDLFCGTGNLSLPLARDGTEVVGVDASASAITDARAAAATAGLDRVRFEAMPALRFLRQQGLAGADLVVLDPPRTGAAAEVTQLARLRAQRVVYVSCDPATLARDIAVLARARYRVGRLQALDLFPQTPHVETVVEVGLAID